MKEHATTYEVLTKILNLNLIKPVRNSTRSNYTVLSTNKLHGKNRRKISKTNAYYLIMYTLLLKFLKGEKMALAGMTQLFEHLPAELRGTSSVRGAGHVPGMLAWSLVGLCVRDDTLSSLPPSPYFPTFPSL